MWKKKKYLVPAIIIVLLIVARILLPFFLEKYVNRTLENIPSYSGHVADIDVALYRGAYVIDTLILKKENSTYPAPLLNFPKSDISLNWSALFKGKIVSEIELHGPELNYIFEDQKKPSPEGEAEIEDWTDALTKLVPININELKVHNGKVNFVQFSTSPNINLMLGNINLVATNLRNVRETKNALPSTINATAVSFGGGDVSLNGKINLMKRIPDMDMEFALKNANVTALNELTLQYVGVDFSSGTFELYSEVAIADGFLEGYLKPMFIDTKLLGKKDESGFFKKLWEGFVGVFKFLLKNQGTNTLATKVPLQGDLNKVDTGLFSTIINIFKNAWIKAFTTNVDENINYGDALNKKGEEKED